MARFKCLSIKLLITTMKWPLILSIDCHWNYENCLYGNPVLVLRFHGKSKFIRIFSFNRNNYLFWSLEICFDNFLKSTFSTTSRGVWERWVWRHLHSSCMHMCKLIISNNKIAFYMFWHQIICVCLKFKLNTLCTLSIVHCTLYWKFPNDYKCWFVWKMSCLLGLFGSVRTFYT